MGVKFKKMEFLNVLSYVSAYQERSQYEARRGNCLVLFSSATNFCTFCSTIRLTLILINIQVATENTIKFDVSTV